MKQLPIDTLTAGQEVIAQYHRDGRLANEEPVRFVRLDNTGPLLTTAVFLRQDDTDTWVPLLVHRFAGEWAHAPNMDLFTVREQVYCTAGALAAWLDGDNPEAALTWLRGRFGEYLTEETRLSEREATAAESGFALAQVFLQ